MEQMIMLDFWKQLNTSILTYGNGYLLVLWIVEEVHISLYSIVMTYGYLGDIPDYKKGADWLKNIIK